MNRFKGLDLVNSLPEELWTEVHNNAQEEVNKAIPKEKQSKKAEWLSEEWKNKEKQKARERGKNTSN